MCVWGEEGDMITVATREIIPSYLFDMVLCDSSGQRVRDSGVFPL